MDELQEYETSKITLKKAFAALPHVDKVKPMRLSGDPSGENILYCNGSNVYIRNLKDPSLVDIFTGHSKLTTVARYSPSRVYIASADVSGKVLLWEPESSSHRVRARHKALESVVRDLAWSPDGLFIVVCGYGHRICANVLDIEDGTQCGKIEGHYKLLNSCSFRPSSPFFIATASEDNSVIFHQGPPYKVKSVHKRHNHYVLVVRFSKDGNTAVSGGADGRLFKYDGKTVDLSKTRQIGSPAHRGPIFDVCYGPTDRHVLTVSGDGTAKIFDVNSRILVRVILFDSNQDMMQGCLWQAGQLVMVNTRGHMYYHSMKDSRIGRRFVVKGHTMPITGLVVAQDGVTIFTGNQECIMCWDAETGANEEVITGQSIDLVDMTMDCDHLIYVDCNRFLHFVSLSDCPQSRRYSESSDQMNNYRLVKLPSQAAAVDAHHGWVVMACLKHVTLVPVEGYHRMYSVVVTSPATCVSINPGATSVAIGHKDGKISLFWMQRGSLMERGTVLMHAAITALAYAPCGAYLAVGAEHRVSALSATDYRELSKREAHTGRVCSVAWSPDSTRFVSSGQSGRVVLWDNVNDSYKRKPQILAHADSYANRIAWLDKNTVVTAGQDGNVKQFTITPL